MSCARPAAKARPGSPIAAGRNQRTGIGSLKIRFNSVFGYYIEVTRANLDKVPPHYVRKQTVANGERFITPDLKEMEAKILGAEERSLRLEYDLFLRVREAVIARVAEIQETAARWPNLMFSPRSPRWRGCTSYVRPEVGEAGVIRIKEGRHPVLDQALTEERFVPNDTDLDGTTQGRSC
jgi:DNA mismatch repair protein MutS